jgi:hypothetical protein
MNFNKREFDNFILKHGHLVIIGHTKKKLHCDCWNPQTNEGDKTCTECFGIGWLYDWKLTKMRRAKYSLDPDKIDSDDKIAAYTSRYKYYAKTEVDIGSQDIIFEFKNKQGRNYISKYIVRNVNTEIGEGGEPSFHTIITSQDVSNQDFMMKKVLELKKSNLEVI